MNKHGFSILLVKETKKTKKESLHSYDSFLFYCYGYFTVLSNLLKKQ